MTKLLKNERAARLGAVLILLLVWQTVAMLVGQSLLLPTPTKVLVRFFTLWGEKSFLRTIGKSFLGIAGGFFAGLALGALLAITAGRFKAVETLLWPFMLTVKSVPVASFIILALVWLSSSDLSFFISFLMVLPVIYTNLLNGIKSLSRDLSEMAEIYRMDFRHRFLYLWLPQMKTYLLTGLSLSLGLAWKAGIAAEVIGIPAQSIGEALYESKAYLNTVDLFAWTVVIVLISFLFEKLVTGIVKSLYRAWEVRA